MTAHEDLTALYRQDGRPRWERLAADMVASGDVRPEQLDLTSASLRTAWTWLLPRLRRRAPGERADPSLQPPWFSGLRWAGYDTWDDVSLDRVGGVVHLLGEVLAAQPGAVRTTGEAGTADAGEPTVLLPGHVVDVSPVARVLWALGDVDEGDGDPGALADVVERPPVPVDREVLYPRCLELRLRGARTGLLRRPSLLDAGLVADALTEVTGRPVAVPPEGTVEVEHLGLSDWRALLVVQGERGGVRDLRVVVGADREAPSTPARTREVRAVLDVLLWLARAADASVQVASVRPADHHAPRPSGELTAERVGEVLRAVQLA